VWTGCALAAITIVAAGCTTPRMQRLTTKQYTPRPASYPIDLYAGDVETPHDDIALLDSIHVGELTTASRTALVDDMRARARKLGADAVTEVVMLIAPQRGWVLDPQTPFRSWRQGWRDTYFLRGRAIRFKPLRIEDGDHAIEGVRFDFAEGERPAIEEEETEPQVEVYEFTDRFGRRGFATRRIEPGERKEMKVDENE
jgi:hypothetical protein